MAVSVTFRDPLPFPSPEKGSKCNMHHNRDEFLNRIAIVITAKRVAPWDASQSRGQLTFGCTKPFLDSRRTALSPSPLPH